MHLRHAVAISAVAFLAGPVWAAGGGGGPPPGARSAGLSKAERLIDERQWAEAIAVLTKEAERDGSNADVHNWLGYAERNRGNTDAAFAHYARALELDPKHRGAHEYVGEAYLMVGDLAKAKEHLATLAKLCRARCEEYEDLKEHVAEYEAQHATGR
ncbi:MAG TPA: tetratricopeptide repeat protein [Anaeromyxobacter sp.]|nr:tetratricopeptide repeat protein [Anaeromyxobacter sp.]